MSDRMSDAILPAPDWMTGAPQTAPNGAEPPPPPPRLRARLIAVQLGLEIVADDGTTLHPVETRTIRIPASEWPAWDLEVALAQVQAQIEPPS
jgi:hypothetical protein